MSALSQFLRTQKDKFLQDAKDNKLDNWTVVMGNEAGDLDSLVSSIGYAYLSSHLQDQTIALVQTARTDLYLRPENVWAIDELGHLDKTHQDLLCADDLESHSIPRNSFPKVALVDHNTLLTSFQGPNVKVVGVIDHHDDEGNHLDAKVREVVTPVGSCASLVTRHFESSWSDDVPKDLANLLISAICIDTSGLKPGDKGVEIDQKAVEFLLPRCSLEGVSGSGLKPTKALNGLTKDLSKKKHNIDDFNTIDLLRRDYKEYSWAGLTVGLSTVPRGLKEWLEEEPAFWDDVETWMDRRGLAIEGILTTFSSKDGKRREIALVFKSGKVPPEIQKKIFKGMESDKFLKLEQKKKVAVQEGRDARFWNQVNVKATRKQVAPLLKSLVETNAKI